MKDRLLKYLACPVCQGQVALRDGAEQDGPEIMAGQLDLHQLRPRISDHERGSALCQSR